MTTIATIARFGLAGCLLSAALLSGAVSPCAATEVAPVHGAAPSSQGQGSEARNFTVAPAAEVSVPESAHPITVIGFGWG